MQNILSKENRERNEEKLREAAKKANAQEN
jgi:hypothetical protein